MSLPLRIETFQSNRLFPFFEGLLSEGWLKRVQTVGQKIDELDSFTLLVRNGGDLVGAVSLELIELGEK
jgi:serine/threonine-protein kinase HipA